MFYCDSSNKETQEEHKVPISVHLDGPSIARLKERYPDGNSSTLGRAVLQHAPSLDVREAYRPLFGVKAQVTVKGKAYESMLGRAHLLFAAV